MSLFFRTIFLLLLIAIAWYAGNIFYFHWLYWWYDVIMHVVSGACVAMAFFAVSGRYFDVRKTNTVLLGFVAVLVVGVVWEVFEVIVGYTFASDGVFYWNVTISDMFADVSGGLFGTLYSFRFFESNNDKIETNAQ